MIRQEDRQMFWTM